MKWVCRDRTWELGGKPLVMGILNATPDSFSDGGRFLEPGAAVARGMALFADGADIVDVGGESTRPGAEPVAPDEEARRVIPVIRELVRRSGGAISVDTRHAAVAEQALDAGACIVNDVSAMTHEPAMAGVVRRRGAGVVLMHMRGEPRTMQAEPVYGDVVSEVKAFLAGRLAAAEAAGLGEAQVALDPGIGFGKTAEHNLDLIAGLDGLRGLGRPLVLGVSRKRFLGLLTGREVNERLAGSLAALAACVLGGASVMRVHDVRESVDAARVLAAVAGRRRR